MAKNNFLDKNQLMNDNIHYGRKKINVLNPGYTVNLDVLSSGIKSDLDLEKVGSDTRSYLEYHNNRS